MRKRDLFNLFVIIPLCSTILCSCMEYGPMEVEKVGIGLSDGIFISNEGNFGYGNASLSYYDPATKQIENEVFVRVNGIVLGDVAQSVTLHGDLAYVIVNNSGVVYAINKNTFELHGMITGVLSPRYIHFVSDHKAYITDLYSKTITIIDPTTYQITGRIDVRAEGSSNQHPTEQMVQYKNLIFTNCWSYDNKILVIDSQTDTVIDQIEVGIQPTSLVIDKYNKIWTITDGGFQGSPYGYEAPSLYRIDAQSREIEQTFTFKLGDHPHELALTPDRDTLYYINNDVWRMAVTDNKAPKNPFLKYNGTQYYGLGVDPHTSEVYVADALDYSQHGVVYRFSPKGEPLDRFKVGINPGTFCFK